MGVRWYGSQTDHPFNGWAGLTVRTPASMVWTMCNYYERHRDPRNLQAMFHFPELPNMAVTLAFPPPRQAQLAMNAAHPMDDENDLGGLGISVGNHLADHRADDALLEPCVRRRGGPHGLEITGQGGEGDRR
jgi:hypothetical protein